MTQYWIFVSYPYSDFNHGTFSEIAGDEKQSLKWLIGKQTIHRKQLAKGDRVLFYQAGDEGKEIVGSGDLISGLQSDSGGRYFVLVGNVRRWGKPVSIKKMVNNLSFIIHKRYWGLYFQGGIRKIQERDYNAITQKTSR